MRRAGAGSAFSWFIFSAAALVFAQDKAEIRHSGKPGLWEITTATTVQKSPVPPGTRGGPPAPGSHTKQYCFTQAMLDAGVLLPQSRGQCRIENKVSKPGSVTADYVCTGKIQGTGKLETTLPDLEHVNSSIHFAGTMDVNAHLRPIEWTTTSSAVYKGAQCSEGPALPSGLPSK